MSTITQEEIKKIAQLSNIEIHPDEIDQVMKQLEDVLSYAARVQAISGVAPEYQQKVNVFRLDQAIPTPAEPILQEAPEREERYFVVPNILESNS